MHGIEYLLDLNTRYAQEYTDPSVKNSREFYREQHPLEIAVFKCMDGRLKFPRITNTPLGIIQPWRNVGGRFNLGWPTGLKGDITQWYNYAKSRQRACLVIVTYHFSRGDRHRGCAGFDYDTDAARLSAYELKKQFDRVFGSGDGFYTIVAGIDTDFDALVLHGDTLTESLDLATIKNASSERLLPQLRKLFPKMPSHILHDFTPVAARNIEHVRKIKAENRPVITISHCESIIALGRGFTWLHEPNQAIIIGPYDPELHKPITTAARLLLDNLEKGRIPKEHGVVLISSMPYWETGHYQRGAEEKALWLTDFARAVIKAEVPELAKKYDFHWLTAVKFGDTMKLTVLKRSKERR